MHIFDELTGDTKYFNENIDHAITSKFDPGSFYEYKVYDKLPNGKYEYIFGSKTKQGVVDMLRLIFPWSKIDDFKIL